MNDKYEDAQGTMGRLKKGGLVPSCPFSPSLLPLCANFHQERDVWGMGQVITNISSVIIASLNVELLLLLFVVLNMGHHLMENLVQ